MSITTVRLLKILLGHSVQYPLNDSLSGHNALLLIGYSSSNYLFIDNTTSGTGIQMLYSHETQLLGLQEGGTDTLQIYLQERERYWVTQKLPQICTVILLIRNGKVA